MPGRIAVYHDRFAIHQLLDRSACCTPVSTHIHMWVVANKYKFVLRKTLSEYSMCLHLGFPNRTMFCPFEVSKVKNTA